MSEDIVKVEVRNTYSDGHSSVAVVEVAAPVEAALDHWFDAVVYEHTGDGHGATGNLGYCYTATVVEAPSMPSLVGEKREWSGR